MSGETNNVKNTGSTELVFPTGGVTAGNLYGGEVGAEIAISPLPTINLDRYRKLSLNLGLLFRAGKVVARNSISRITPADRAVFAGVNLTDPRFVESGVRADFNYLRWRKLRLGVVTDLSFNALIADRIAMTISDSTKLSPSAKQNALKELGSGRSFGFGMNLFHRFSYDFNDKVSLQISGGLRSFFSPESFLSPGRKAVVGAGGIVGLEFRPLN